MNELDERSDIENLEDRVENEETDDKPIKVEKIKKVSLWIVLANRHTFFALLFFLLGLIMFIFISHLCQLL